MVLIAASFLAAFVMAARAGSVSRQSTLVGEWERDEKEGEARHNIARRASLVLLGVSGILLVLMHTSSFLVPPLAPDFGRVLFGVLFVLATISFFGSAIAAYVGHGRQRGADDEPSMRQAHPREPKNVVIGLDQLPTESVRS